MTTEPLSSSTMSLVESTKPTLQEHGVAVTTRFYERLFAEYPDVAPMFATAAPGQPERLAGAVLAYATNIRNLDALGPAVQRIAEKHVAAGVAPDHYGVVGTLLLESMVEVLGEIPADVLAAWEEAYGFLANIFISTEAELSVMRAR